MTEKVFKTILIDDEIQAMEELEKLLADHPFIQIVEKVGDPEQALAKITLHKPDLLFLDIRMPGKTGFEIASEILQGGLRPDIIFVTAYDQFAIRAIRHAAFDFLLKPVSREELEIALARFREKTEQTEKEKRYHALVEDTVNRPRVKLSTTGGFTLVRPEDIVYIEADWNYAEIHFEKEKSEMVTMNIGKVVEMLPKNDFFRISRSIVINLAYLTRVSRKKREALLIRDRVEYRFKIPLLNIRKLEQFLE